MSVNATQSQLTGN